MYVDDASCAEHVKLDKVCVPLLPTAGPHNKMLGCNLAIPGAHTQLQHRLHDIADSCNAVGMKLNAAKTKVIMFNFTKMKQAVP